MVLLQRFVLRQRMDIDVVLVGCTSAFIWDVRKL